MEELSIRIKIAGREYPMKVKPEEEEGVRKAAKSINDRIKSYKDQFGIDDKQDLLAMVAFDSLVDKMNAEEQQDSGDDSVLEKINYLNKIVSQAL